MKTMHHSASSIDPLEETFSSDGDAGAVEAPRREPVWRVVGASLATGLVGAIVLTLVVVAGAGEHVITGSALLAFATGWAMLTALSSRFTTRPQRWALVPAAFMAAAGTILLIARPDDRALDVAGWLWPPVMFALAVWTATKVRRGFDGRVRWLLYPVVASLALGSVGGMFETAAHDRLADPAPGTMYDVGGHRLHLDCTGSGSPTVVLENGLGATSLTWSRVTAAVSGTTRVCAYDRAGQGWSDDIATPQDGLAVAADLHVLLDRAGEAGPYVLVGHSSGGAYVMTYAAEYPDEVAGMVLLDSMSPYAFSVLPDFASEQSMMRRGLGVLPSLARMGIARVLPAAAWSSLPEPAASQHGAFASSPRGMRSMRDEQSVFPEVLDQAKALDTLGTMPLVVVTATESLDEIEGWRDAQDDLAALSTNSSHRVADATHEGLVDDEASFAASVTAIGDVVTAIRTGEPVAAG